MSAPHRSGVVRAAISTLLAFGLIVLAAVSVESIAPVAEVIVGWWPVLVVLVLQGIALAWSTDAPARVLVLVAALPLGIVFVDLREISTVTAVAIVVAAYVAGTRSRGPRLRTAVLASAVAVAATEMVSWRTMPLPFALLSSAALVVAVLGAPLAVAYVVVTRRRMVDALRAENVALERVQSALLDAAITHERAGIARELHDIAAHHMSGIALMCAAVERQVDIDPNAARDGLMQIKVQSRLVLSDLRQAVGLLRGGDQHEVEAHRIEAVRDLVATHSTGEQPVTLQVVARDGHAAIGGGLGPLAHLAGYRMVQESLTNAAQHAPNAPRAVVIDDTAAGFLTITVNNDPALHVAVHEQTKGFGLRGMRERAELVRGTLQYGPTPEGGWLVSLMLPRVGADETGGMV